MLLLSRTLHYPVNSHVLENLWCAREILGTVAFLFHLGATKPL